MHFSFRRALGDSHVAAVILALLLAWPIRAMLQVLREPFTRAVMFILTMIAIRDIPYTSPGMNIADRIMIAEFVFVLCQAVLALVTAILVSHWVYGSSPVHVLRMYRAQLLRKTNV
jgi:hypothetical protein